MRKVSIDRLRIQVATLKSTVAKWEAKELAALADGNLVGGREARNEAHIARTEMNNKKYELRKLELGY